MRSRLLIVLALFAVGCADEAPAPSASTDTGVLADAGRTETSPTTPDAVADTAAPTDGTPCTSCAALVGKVLRKAGTKPSAGGKGSLYIAVFDGNPILDSKSAKLVARTLIENVDMSADTASVDYRVEGIPPAATGRQVVAFLDDNKTATEANPAPDKGDLVTIDIAGFSGIKVTLPKPGDHTLGLQLNAALP